MLPLTIEITDQNGIQWRPAYRNLRFAKSFFGGEDLWMAFVLDRAGDLDYPDVAYGNDVILRNGLAPRFAGEIRQIESDLETVTVKVLGRFVHLDDYGYGGEGKLWCDSRFGKWKATTRDMDTSCWPERFQMDSINRLYIAPRKHERFALTAYFGQYYYWSPYDLILRVSFDYEFVDPDNWVIALYSNDGTPEVIGTDTLEWSADVTSSGVKDITLPTPRALIHFRLFYAALEAEYTGQTGACRAVITNLRVWGEKGPFSKAIESPSVIHIAEDVSRRIGRDYFVRDSFSDVDLTLLTAHSPDIDTVGGGWIFGAGQQYEILANEANPSVVAGGRAIATIDSGESDGTVCVDATTFPAGWVPSALIFRYQDIDHFWAWYLMPTDGSARLGKWDNPVWTWVWNQNIGIVGDTYNLMVKLRGDRIDCYIGGTWYCGTNDIWLQTETEYGLFAEDIDLIKYDNLEMYQGESLISADDELVQESVFVRDTFVDPNGTSLDAHVPNISKERAMWVESGNFDIQGNEANVVAVNSFAIINSGVSDGIVTVDATTLAAGNHAVVLIFRYLNALNFWYWYLNPNLNWLRLYKRVGGVSTPVYSGTPSLQYSITYNLMVKLRGDRIDCYLGGIWYFGINDDHNINRTFHGIRGDTIAGIRFDNFEVFQALPLWPLFYEKGQSCHKALVDAASYGDWDFRALGWGIEPGGNRLYLKRADRDRVRYVIPPHHASRLSAKGQTDKGFVTEAWGKYIDEDGMERLTEKYYAHVTSTGIVANTTVPAADDSSAQTVYGVIRERVINFGRVDAILAVEYLRQYLEEHAHPQVKSSFEIFGPVRDLFKGGAWIQPYELEMGYVVQIPYFRAVEVEGTAGSDIRWGVGGGSDTTFLLVAMQYDAERGRARLIPEGASEDLERLMKYTREFERGEEKSLTDKRREASFSR